METRVHPAERQRAGPDQGHKLQDVICSIHGTWDKDTKEMKLHQKQMSCRGCTSFHHHRTGNTDKHKRSSSNTEGCEQEGKAEPGIMVLMSKGILQEGAESENCQRPDVATQVGGPGEAVMQALYGPT